jgi:DNA-binding NarL/FixJ family response regulator
VLAGLKAGAKGYLLKDVSLEQLVGAIQTVADGGSLVQPAMTQRLLSAWSTCATTSSAWIVPIR